MYTRFHRWANPLFLCFPFSIYSPHFPPLLPHTTYTNAKLNANPLAQYELCTAASVETVIEIARIERLHPHETVLTARRVTLAVRIERQTVDRSEMALQTSELLLVH